MIFNLLSLIRISSIQKVTPFCKGTGDCSLIYIIVIFLKNGTPKNMVIFIDRRGFVLYNIQKGVDEGAKGGKRCRHAAE